MKQRLVGAIVLITLGIVFIPLLLNGVNQSSPEQDDADASEKQARNGFSSRIVPLATPDAIERSATGNDQDTILDLPMVGAPRTKASKPAIPLVNKSKVKPVTKPAPDTDSTQAADSTAESGPAPKPDPKPRSKPKPEPEPKPQVSKAAKAKTPSTTSAVVPVRESQPVGGEKKGWVVQVGSFAAELNAQKLRDRLEGQRYHAYVDAISSETGSMFRVRVGPVEEREQAEKLQQQLARQASLKGILVHLP